MWAEGINTHTKETAYLGRNLIKIKNFEGKDVRE